MNSIEREILKLKEGLNAVILAHFYQNSDIQDIADFVGDSLDLSRRAASTEADVIVFCGVRFMAEVAKILSPNRVVLVPDKMAGCSLEESCNPTAFAKFKAQYPNHLVLTYINSSVEVKAMSDIIVTSTNAERIISQIPANQPLIFAPDRHLGAWLNKKTGRNMVLWQGACVVHDTYSERELLRLIAINPKAFVIAHPECPEALLRYAHHIGSTSSLLAFVGEPSRAGMDFIVLTELGILHQMQKANPSATLLDVPGLNESCASCNACPYMKLNDMEKLYRAMKDCSPQDHVIEVNREHEAKARVALMKMLEMSVGK